jgi:hypothetical protein
MTSTDTILIRFKFAQQHYVQIMGAQHQALIDLP